MQTLMEIWKERGVQMPFMVRDPDSCQVVVITSFYWPKRFFEGEMNGAKVALTSDWRLWQYVREA